MLLHAVPDGYSINAKDSSGLGLVSIALAQGPYKGRLFSRIAPHLARKIPAALIFPEERPVGIYFDSKPL